jgi:hypothetical protein
MRDIRCRSGREKLRSSSTITVRRREEEHARTANR